MILHYYLGFPKQISGKVAGTMSGIGTKHVKTFTYVVVLILCKGVALLVQVNGVKM
jgi:hypothetical protein